MTGTAAGAGRAPAGVPDGLEVLFVASEAYPLIKTGGLADVVGALPLALASVGVRARVLVPGYRQVMAVLIDPVVVEVPGASVGGPLAGRWQLVSATAPGGLDVLVFDAPELFDRPGGPYVGPDGRDWPDNDLRFGALSWIASRVATVGVTRVGGTRWRPDLVHLHDWQTGLAAAYLHLERAGGRSVPPVVLTVHNLAFQGLFSQTRLEPLGLPAALYDIDGVEFHGHVSFLKAGVQWADQVTTVSPTYAREIVTPTDGMGFDGVLQANRHGVVGVVNGIDTQVWDPETDPFLPYRFSSRRPAGKAKAKRALQAELGLDAEPAAPLLCVVSRLTHQKGLDVLLAAAPTAIEAGAQFALLGSGEPALELGWLALAADHPGRVSVVIGYDEPLSHRIQAGSDMIVVPSRFEPCGLTQLSGLRYGAVPIVSRVGGLADTVIDANPAALADQVATGVVFAPVEAGSMTVALERALALYQQEKVWKRLVRRAMTRDVGWRVAAPTYRALYDEVLGRP